MQTNDENKQWITLDQVYAGYLDCRKRKKSSKSCAEFQMRLIPNIVELHRKLNDHTYTIGKSIAFCVTRPKIREVFAAEFTDRIVHHIVIQRLNPLFEKFFIADTYNCRKGKGTMFGVKKVAEMMERHPNGWVVKCDLQGFFMSIDRKLLADRLEDRIRLNYKHSDIEDIVWLCRIIALHAPEENCEKRGNLKIWDRLPDNKTLFRNGKGKGMAIGNLTSQIFANFYLCILDFFLAGIPGIEYGRYVDDFVMIGDDKDFLLSLLLPIRELLSDNCMTLHPNKIYIQPVSHGVNFLGSTIKDGRIYTGNRTVGNFENFVRFFNEFPYKERFIESFAQRYNSYAGYLSHTHSYNIRLHIWRDLVGLDVKQYCHITNNYTAVKVFDKYKRKTKILRRHVKTRHRKIKMDQDGARLLKRR